MKLTPIKCFLSHGSSSAVSLSQTRLPVPCMANQHVWSDSTFSHTCGKQGETKSIQKKRREGTSSHKLGTNAQKKRQRKLAKSQGRPRDGRKLWP